MADEGSSFNYTVTYGGVAARNYRRDQQVTDRSLDSTTISARVAVSTIGFDRLDAFLAGIGERLAQPRPWLNDAADKVELLAAQSFTDQGPNWRPLARSTQADRRRKGYGPTSPILVRKGDLKASATSKGKGGGRNHIRRFRGTRTIEVGSKDFRAYWMERGTKNMPARPFYVITLDEQHLFGLSAADYVMGRWAAAASASSSGTGTANVA